MASNVQRQQKASAARAARGEASAAQLCGCCRRACCTAVLALLAREKGWDRRGLGSARAVEAQTLP